MARTRRRVAVVAALLWLALTALGNSPALASDESIVSTSSSQHLWFVIEEQRGKSEGVPRVFRMFHHAAAMADATVSSEATIPKLSQMPEAMTAWDSQLWIVNPAQPNQLQARRDVFSVRVRYDATFNIYQHDPFDRLTTVEPLPAEGRLAGFVALASGPVALLMPTERGVSSVALHDGTRANKDELAAPRLLRLTNGSWADVPLPSSLDASDIVQLGASRTDEGVLCLISAAPVRRGTVATSQFHRFENEQWTTSTVAIDVASVRSMACVLDECAAVVNDNDGETASVVILRPGRLHTVATFPKPDGPWTMLGLGSDLRLITRGSVNQVYMQRFDPISGEAKAREQFEALRPSLAIMLHLIVLVLVVTVASISAFVLAKWRGEGPLDLPEHWHVLGPFGRALALMIDMIPAGLITMLFTQCSFQELINSPIAVPRLDLAFPYLMMTGLTMLHSGLWELMHGTSLGKSILNARVADEHGKRLSTRATLVRLAFKTVVLCVPILVFPTIVSRRGQGLPERASGAIVIGKDETAEVSG